MNPIREIRKRRGQTLAAFSDWCGVHLQALYLNECGCYTHVLPAIRTYIGSLGYEVADLDEKYANYQEKKQIQTGLSHSVAEFELGPPSLIEHPIVSFRRALGMSRMGFAKSFCVHPAFLYKLERGEAFGLSFQLRQALTTAGLPVVLVAELDYRSREFAEYKRNKTYRTAV